MNIKELLRRSTGNSRWYEVPFVKVSSVKEYFDLPKNEREWHGLYQIPYALPWEGFHKESEGWDTFYNKIQKEYPVQHFFRKWIFSSYNPVYSAFMCCVWWPLREIRHTVRTWITPLHPRWRASLPRHKYCDISELVVNSNFALIKDFYWEETVSSDFVDWEGEPAHKEFYSQLKAYVHWIEKELPELDEKLLESLNRVSSVSEGSYQEKYKESIQLEKQKEDKTTEILTWFIVNRGFFWT